jgi:Nucleotidyl transferase AbiEii toxin, Type IV TA system
MNQEYVKTVRLLLAVAPVIFRESPFALKGGTAINLFLRDMPRLSVDLDLVVIDHVMSREEAFRVIGEQMETTKAALTKLGCLCDIGSTPDGNEVKLFVQRDRVRVKVEVNHVFRGTVLPVAKGQLTPQARALFQTDVQATLLDTAELYGSKLVAAMDRQHPRDLFDVIGLYDNGGLTPEMIECFVCYVAGHNRPVHEVLFGNPIDIAPAFANEFSGMTTDAVTLDHLLAARHRLFQELPMMLTVKQREFLLSLVHAEPDWSLMACSHLADLPAIRWKLENLRRLKKLNPKKFKAQAATLTDRFER